MVRRFDRRIREYQTTPEAVAGTHFQIDYRFRPEVGFTLEESAFRTLLITTVGTIQPLAYEQGFNRGLAKRSVDEAGGYILIQEDPSGQGLVTLALPLYLCSETESLTGLVQLIGSGAEYGYTQEYWVERLTLPPPFIDRFRGPRFGIEGLRRILGVAERPPLGLVLTPRSGVPIDALLSTARAALRGGCDFICDDVLLTDPTGEMSLENRIPQLVQIASEESIRTGEKKSYFCNIIASPATSLRLAKLAIAGGVDVLIANAAVMSVGGLEDLVNGLDDGARVPVISTDMAVALMSRAPTHAHGKVTQTGMSEAIFAKLARLAGADGVHTGTVGSECYGEMEWNRTSRAISEPMRYIAPCFAVASSDLGLKQIWPNMSSLGPDLLFQVSSGIVNYPDGPEEGAQMFRKFLEQLDPINMDDDAADEAVAQIAAKNKTARIILDHSD